MPRLLGSFGRGGLLDRPPDGRSRRVTFLLDQYVPDAIGRVAAQGGHTVTRLIVKFPPRRRAVKVLVPAEISRIRSGFRLSLRLRWRKSLENRARVFESVQVETYPLPHRSATVIHCCPTRCFCAITLAKRTARCIATGVSSKTADCALLTPFNAPSFIWARSMTPSKRLGAKALRCSTRPLNGPNKSVYSPRTATSRRMSSTGRSDERRVGR